MTDKKVKDKARCETCKANKVCDHNKYGFENCGNYIPNETTGSRPYSTLEGCILQSYGEDDLK